MLETRVEHGPDSTVYLTGEMDLDCADALRGAAMSVAVDTYQLTLDFGGVRFIDSSGTGIFVRLCLDLLQQGVKVRVRSLTPQVQQVFDMLKVHELVGEEIFPE